MPQERSDQPPGLWPCRRLCDDQGDPTETYFCDVCICVLCGTRRDAYRHAHGARWASRALALRLFS
jgi:hypothetical protein